MVTHGSRLAGESQPVLRWETTVPTGTQVRAPVVSGDLVLVSFAWSDGADLDTGFGDSIPVLDGYDVETGARRFAHNDTFSSLDYGYEGFYEQAVSRPIGLEKTAVLAARIVSRRGGWFHVADIDRATGAASGRGLDRRGAEAGAVIRKDDYGWRDGASVELPSPSLDASIALHVRGARRLAGWRAGRRERSGCFENETLVWESDGFPLALREERALVAIGETVHAFDRDGRSVWSRRGVLVADRDDEILVQTESLEIVSFADGAVRARAGAGEIHDAIGSSAPVWVVSEPDAIRRIDGAGREIARTPIGAAARLVAADHTNLFWLDGEELVCEKLADAGREAWRLMVGRCRAASEDRGVAVDVANGVIATRDGTRLAVYDARA